MSLLGLFFGLLASLSLALAGPELPQRVLLGLPPVSSNVLLPPRPYDFGFESGDGLGTLQHRRESSNGAGVVTGSYGYKDPLGVYRNVEYTADAGGYRAVVRSNEPGLDNKNVADAAYFVEAPPPAALAQGLAYLSNQIGPKVLV